MNANKKNKRQSKSSDNEIEAPDQPVKPTIPDLKAGKEKSNGMKNSCGCGDSHNDSSNGSE